jgi:glycosyltransferase involved in cell wall biosynthesis
VATDRAFSVCVKGFPGADHALRSLERTVGLTRHFSLASTNPRSPEVRFLAQHLREQRPALLVLGAWTPLYESFVDALAGLDTRIAVYWTSTAAQGDISDEVAKLVRMLQAGRTQYLFCASDDLASALRGRVAGVLGLPPTLVWPRARVTGVRRTTGRPTVSLFFPAAETRRKNVTNALLAVAALRTPPRLLLNGLSARPGYRELLEVLGVGYHDLGWIEDRRRYERTLSRVDVGLQPSLTESYDYVAAEHLSRGVPVVGSSAVPALARLPREIRRALVVDDVDGHAGIRDKLQALLDDPAARHTIGRRAADAVRELNERDIRRAARALRTVLDRG